MLACCYCQGYFNGEECVLLFKGPEGQAEGKIVIRGLRLSPQKVHIKFEAGGGKISGVFDRPSPDDEFIMDNPWFSETLWAFVLRYRCAVAVALGCEWTLTLVINACRLPYLALFSEVHPFRAANPHAHSGANVEMPIRVFKETFLLGLTNQPLQRVLAMLGGSKTGQMAWRIGMLPADARR